MGCEFAVPTDEFHGFECRITGDSCIYLFPNQRKCAEEYGDSERVNVNDLEVEGFVS